MTPSFQLSVLSLALLGLANPAWSQTIPAQAAPSAGQVLRDLQLAPSAAPQAVPLQRIEQTPDLAQKGEATVTIKAIRITGNTEVATSQLQPLVADLVGTQQSLTQLNTAARRITAYYRNQGFAVARA